MSLSSLRYSLSTAEGGYFLLVVLLTPCLDYFLIHRRYTSSASRLRIFQFRALYLILISLLGYALHDHHTILHASTALQKRAGWHTLYDGWLYYTALGLSVASHLSNLHETYRCSVDQPYRATKLHMLRPIRCRLPVTATERTWYSLYCIAAAVCEHFIYRVLLLHWLAAHLSPLQAVVAAGAVFGIAHCYWHVGMFGDAMTALLFGLAGLIVAVEYVMYGSVVVLAVSRAMSGLAMLVRYRPTVDAPDLAKDLIKGCELDEQSVVGWWRNRPNSVR